MKIEESIDNKLLKIKIIGDLDASSAIQLDDSMGNALSAGHTKVIIDCEELDYISSAGIGVFISYLEEFKDKNGQFVFFSMHEKVYNTFQILGLANIMSFIDTEKEAKELVNES